jgi:methylated-DNA-[protein]-cysteine S-methyltransferase
MSSVELKIPGMLLGYAKIQPRTQISRSQDRMPEPLELLIDLIPTPIGPMMIAADQQGNLRVALFTEDEAVVRRQLALHYSKYGFNFERTRNPHNFCATISRYFNGELNAIDNIPVATGGTPFQQKVWHELRNIACGSTASYGELARRIGHPTAVRAVGAANGDNPVAVIVPCHRVIGSNGSLTGYGGGLERKRWLLDHENRLSRLF